MMKVKASLLVSCVIVAIVASYLAAWYHDDARLDPMRQEATEMADQGQKLTVKSLENDSGYITVDCGKKGRFYIDENCPNYSKWRQLEKGDVFHLQYANHPEHLFGPSLPEQPDCFLAPEEALRKVAER